MNLYIFFLTASVVLVGILFFVCKDLGSLIVTMNYFQMYHFYKELKEVLFFFFLLAFEKQKKN